MAPICERIYLGTIKHDRPCGEMSALKRRPKDERLEGAPGLPAREKDSVIREALGRPASNKREDLSTLRFKDQRRRLWEERAELPRSVSRLVLVDSEPVDPSNLIMLCP